LSYAEQKTRLRRAAVRDELPTPQPSRLGRNHRKGRLVAAEFLKNVGDGIVAYYQLFIDLP